MASWNIYKRNKSISSCRKYRHNKDRKRVSRKKDCYYSRIPRYKRKGDITTFGRGGSDTTAVAVAAALKADKCYIFSDVDGVYSTDPNKIQDAKKISELSYEEMQDISNEGAKVLHNRCVEIGKDLIFQ